MRFAKKINSALYLFLFLLMYIFGADALYANTMEKPSFEYPMVIVIPSYNNEKWCEKNLASVLQQNYHNYRIIYVNDASKDDTQVLVEKRIKELNLDACIIDFNPTSNAIGSIVENFNSDVNCKRHFFTLINNIHRAGALANLYRMIHSCSDNEIIVTVDGDDWLANDDVLSTLNSTYQSGEVWFTHGTLKEYPWGHVAWSEPIPEPIIKRNTAREFKCPSHLRTFYTWLFKKIKLEDFLFQGEFFSMAWDMAIMYPLVEMAAERHAFIKQVLYIYNMSNPINDNRVNAQLQNEMDAWIRKKTRYARLNNTEVVGP